jgi:hypothetical protein
MKKVIFYVVSLIVMSIFIWILRNNQKPSETLGLTVMRDYILVDGDRFLEVDVFINQKDHLLSEIEYHLVSYLSDSNDSKKLELSLIDITQTHHEIYLNMPFYAYQLRFELPYFGNHYEIHDAYLSLSMIHQKTYRFSIGRLEVFPQIVDNPVMEWHSLIGSKKPLSYQSRLYEITIGIDHLSSEIDSIDIGFKTKAAFWLSENELKIRIPEEPYLRNAMPIIIHFNNGTKQMIHRFVYFYEYQLLKESGPLVRMYALD